MDLFTCVGFLTFSFALGFPNYNLSDNLYTDNNQSETSISLSINETFACPEKKHWEPCTAHCAKNCDNFNEQIRCLPVCMSGCVCDEGYVLDPTGKCISPSECQQQVDSNSHEPESFCPPNEEFSPCLAHCQRNCINWSDPTLTCSKMCVPGCICSKGMVRGPHGTCIRVRQCPPRESMEEMSEIQCPVDEYFDRCTAHCQKNCSTRNEELPCKRICIPGCVCDEGMVRGPSGNCVFQNDCSTVENITKANVANENTISCPIGEHRSQYISFLNMSKFCIHGKGNIEFCPPSYLKGCVCDKGLSRGPDNKCIDPKLKPKANELTFMHVSSYTVNGQQQESREREKLEKDSSDNETILDHHIRRLEDIEEEKFEPTEITDELALTDYDDLSDMDMKENEKSYFSTDYPLEKGLEDEVMKIDQFFVCPNREKCLKWCRSKNIHSGDCIGQGFNLCVCVQGLKFQNLPEEFKDELNQLRNS